MAFEKIKKDILSKNFKPVYVLHGEEDYFIDELCNLILQNALQPHEKDFNQTIVYGKETEVATVIDAAKRFPMMAERQVVVLKEAQALSRTLNQFQNYTLKPVDTTVLVICHKTKKIDGRLKFIGNAKKTGVVFEAKKMKENEIAAWMQKDIESKGFKIENKALQMMTELIGTNLNKAKIEIEKLKPNLKNGETINSKIVEKYIGVHAEYNVFELQKALITKNIEKAFKIAKFYSINKDAPMVVVLSSLFRFFKQLFIYLQNTGKPTMEIAKAMGMHNTYFIKDFKTASKFYNISSVYNAFELIHKCDLESKGVGSTNNDEWEIYKELIYKLLK